MAAIAAVSVVFTISLVAIFAASRGVRSMLETGPLGIMTLVGWALTLSVAPIAAIQLWRYKESGRLAGLVVFGFGVVYYVLLSLPQARRACS
ncbi:MAG: hypothetical protein LC804_12420 [Acidobacteria bacterium]|nr:hypothetical protein [Acidobacteriota bacterium]